MEFLSSKVRIPQFVIRVKSLALKAESDMQNASYSVFELTIKYKYPVDRVSRDDNVKIKKVVDRLTRRGKHSDYTVSILVLSPESSSKLMDRVRPGLQAVSCIDNFWVQTVGPDAVGLHGEMDPFTSFVRELWAEANKRNKAKNFRQPRPGDVFLKHGIKDFERKAAVKMGLRGPRKWKPSADPDR